MPFGNNNGKVKLYPHKIALIRAFVGFSSPRSLGYNLDRTLSGSYDSDIIPQNELNAEVVAYMNRVRQGLQDIANMPLEILADRVRSTDRKFAIGEAKYTQQKARELLDNFHKLTINTLGQAIGTSKIGFPSQEMIRHLKDAIKSGVFAKAFRIKHKTSTPPQKVASEVFLMS